MARILYFDHNATTPMASEVLEAMLPYFREAYGNAGSAHVLGHRSEGAVVEARAQVARLLGVDPAEVVFTSGGTESLNHAVRGVWEALPAKRHMVFSAVEHSASMALVAWLRSHGTEVSLLGVDGQGNLDLENLEATLRPDTALVSVMTANNESGVGFPVEDIGRLCRARGVLFHTDATQAVGRMAVVGHAWGADLLTLSGHKLCGPKGTGALFIRRGVRLRPLMVGGSQERGRRGGTENVPGWVGLGRACALAGERLGDWHRVQALRDRLEAALLDLPGTVVHGRQAPRLPNTTLVSFAGVEGEGLLLRLSQGGICVSVGSACTTGQREPSHVLMAMGVDPGLAKGTLRISLGQETEAEDLETLVSQLTRWVGELRGDPAR